MDEEITKKRSTALLPIDLSMMITERICPAGLLAPEGLHHDAVTI